MSINLVLAVMGIWLVFGLLGCLIAVKKTGGMSFFQGFAIHPVLVIILLLLGPITAVMSLFIKDERVKK